ncbi:MAG: aminodeoxychorismate synthase component I [Acidobacteriaceae bacterium]
MTLPGKSSDQPAPPWTALPAAAHALVAREPDSILLETARFDASNRHSYLFVQPRAIFKATSLEQLPWLFAQIEAALADGLHVAGYLSYECGGHFEPSTARATLADGLPLVWMGAYAQPKVFDHRLGRFLGSEPKLPSIYDYDDKADHGMDPYAQQPCLRIAQADYIASIGKIKEYIAAGDTYQVNFTDIVEFDVTLPPSRLYDSLLSRQSVAYAGYLHLPEHSILSFSPELFFRIEDGRITTRPMKGTMARGLDEAEDRGAALRLQGDEKNRSEHVMIVDLLRNDLGRISEPGSVRVEKLFSVERYETLLQMTSTISATLRRGVSFYEVFRSLFPCGSITGAPKVRTMQIIRQLEPYPRGVYTGAIGYIAPNRNASFSVAIRTLVLGHQEGRMQAQMGVGGGIVADSVPEEEYRECLLKAAFLSQPLKPFQLIETMLWQGSFQRLRLHLDRLASSAAYFHFGFCRSAVERRLQGFACSLDAGLPHRIRLLLGPEGEPVITSQPLEEYEAEQSRGLILMVSAQRTDSSDLFLRHKTTLRSLYDQSLAQARAQGCDEILFFNQRDELTEGAISNVFLEIAGHWYTPPVICGVLPGVMRRHLLETLPQAEERILFAADLKAADAIWLCNSLRGLRRVAAIRSSGNVRDAIEGEDSKR